MPIVVMLGFLPVAALLASGLWVTKPDLRRDGGFRLAFMILVAAAALEVIVVTYVITNFSTPLVTSD
jgi:hypothetical protein